MRILYTTFLTLILLTSGCTITTAVEDWRIVKTNHNKINAPERLKTSANFEDNTDQNSKLAIFVNFPDSSQMNKQKRRSSLKIFPAKPYARFSPPKFLATGLLSFYRSVLTHGIKTRCPFCPTCSGYSVQALQEYGLVLGYIMTIDRLIRCNRDAGDKYFLRSRTINSGNTTRRYLCLIDEPANNNIFNRKVRKK